jgi:hypothetical protein
MLSAFFKNDSTIGKKQVMGNFMDNCSYRFFGTLGPSPPPRQNPNMRNPIGANPAYHFMLLWMNIGTS